MPLKPVGGLRRLVNDSHDVAKVQLNIPAGDTLEVSDDVAAQLAAASTHFRDPADVPEPGPQIVKDANGEIDYDRTPAKALAAAGLRDLAAEAAHDQRQIELDREAERAAKKAPAKKATKS